MAEKLDTIGAQTLLLKPLETPPFIVEDLLPVGLSILVGAPKIAKSWLVLHLALLVSMGTPLWGFATRKCDVLYLCLEDTASRVQHRLFLLTDEASDRLRFATRANVLSEGLIDQLEEHVAKYPETGLIIIDTLQMVRKQTRDSAYAADYADISALKRFADDHALAVMLVHHTRKQPDGDVLNTVSGTTGITGSADSTLLLTRESRREGEGTLYVTGRDIESRELKLRFANCRWELIEEVGQEESAQRSIPDAVLRVVELMRGHARWEGTASELLTELDIEDVTSSVLSKLLNEHHGYLADKGIGYSRERTGQSRTIILTGDDGMTADLPHPLAPSLVSSASSAIDGTYTERCDMPDRDGAMAVPRRRPDDGPHPGGDAMFPLDVMMKSWLEGHAAS